MFKLVTFAAAAALSAGAATAATAPKAPRYDDLDLSRARDAQAYSARLNRAVDSACEREGGGFGAGQQLFDCRARTRAAMTASLPESARAAYAAGLGGGASTGEAGGATGR